MNILVVGSGGREHALCRKFVESPQVSTLYCAPGNAGIALLAECVDISPENIFELARFAAERNVDLTFIGGESALALGVVDEFERRGLRIIGPRMAAARLESSKAFAKDFMARHRIPTAKYRTAGSVSEAVGILNSGEFGGESMPVVVKADGLAAGKGVVVAADRSAAIAAIDELESLAGRDATRTIVLEECLFGSEVSLIMFVDGENYALMPPTRDHKRIGDGDTGPNTGGMGAITDDTLLSKSQTADIIERIIVPTLNGCREEGFPFQGILFLGLMMTDSGASVLEYNVRFGDPETQVILARLNTDIVEICEAIESGALNKITIDWLPGNSACVVLAAKGYPQRPETGAVISGLTKAEKFPGVVVIHAGTAVDQNGEIVTAGGRVLGVTAVGSDLDEALGSAYSAVKEISWEGIQYRKDIGRSV
ncbi:MAG: phosphoribosylamine--glycine ligase [Pyrinomonadaceae bacterium]